MPAVARQRLPGERAGITHKVRIGGMSGFITANRQADGSLGEVLIHGFGKLGMDTQGWADTFAIMLSINMQQGGDLAQLARKFAHKRFGPRGETDNPRIPECSCIPDYVLRWLALQFGDADLKRELDLADQEETLA